MLMCRRFIIAVALLACLPGTHARAMEALDFREVRAVVAGVLTWKDASISPFSPVHRKDAELCRLLKERGVPADHVAFLEDGKATRAEICSRLRAAARDTGPSSTLIFYYAGHGFRTQRNRTFLACWDVVKADVERTGLDVEEVRRILQENVRGGRVILLADCCYSGALGAVAGELARKGIRAMSLTSASSSNVSTSNWTFTQTLIDDLGGDPFADRNGDSAITLREVADEVAAAMKCRERQVAGALLGADELAVARPSASAARARVQGSFSPGAYVFALRESRWAPARILSACREGYSCRFYSYADSTDAALTRKDLKEMTFLTYPRGKDVTAAWGGQNYAAKILKVENGFHWITYPGWDAWWDEWVTYDRIVNLEGLTRRRAEVEYEGTWYPAEVLDEQGGRYFIRYEGYDYSWDEWVGEGRIRFSSSRRPGDRFSLVLPFVIF